MDTYKHRNTKYPYGIADQHTAAPLDTVFTEGAALNDR